MRTFKICFLNNFKYAIYNIVNYSHHAIQYNPMTYFFFITASLYLLTPFIQSPSPTTNLFSISMSWIG